MTEHVEINNKITNAFDVNQGVRQGCILSHHLLFNIFMSDLQEILDQSHSKPQKVHTETALFGPTTLSCFQKIRMD